MATTQMLSRTEFLTILNAQRNGMSLKKFAPLVGVSFQFLGKVVNGAQNPGPQLAKAMGYEQVVAFVPEGEAAALLPPPPTDKPAKVKAAKKEKAKAKKSKPKATKKAKKSKSKSKATKKAKAKA